MNIVLILVLITILMILIWAVLGGKPAPAPEQKKDHNDEPEKILRRRSSDRAIEKEFPGERRAEDRAAEGVQEKEFPSGAMQLPFPANDIISDTSRFRLYKRALINSEIYARRGDIETSIALFKGVRDRILDSGIRNKIDTNIEYLNHFRNRREEDFKRRIESSYSPQQPTEVRLKIDGPMPQTINIGMPEKSIDTNEIIEKLSEQISRELGTLKTDIERLKTRPDEKFALDDYAEFAHLQYEFNNLKKRFGELTEDRIKTLNELNRIRELKEKELQQEKPPESQPDLLRELKKEIDNFDGLKQSLESLHEKIEDIKSLKIPESSTRPTIIEAKYDSPIPIHFDPAPVIELLDRINRQARDERYRPEPPEEKPRAEETIEEPAEEEIITGDEHAEIIQDKEAEIFPEPEEGLAVDEEAPAAEHEITPEEFTLEEIVSMEAETPLTEEMLHEEESHEKGDALFPDEYLPPEPEPHVESVTVSAKVDAMDVDIFLDQLTGLEAEEFINEPGAEEIEPATDEEALFEEPELKPSDIPAEPAVSAEDEMQTGTADLAQELSDEELRKLSEEEEPPYEQTVTEKPGDKTGEAGPDAEEILRLEKEKEKEIEKHTDAEEDPNEFELLSEYGQLKDESTLTDEDIFEKILSQDKKKPDDSAFEIIGDSQKEEQEYSLDDSRLDGKMKAEQDFYRKFIKADRIKKRELPILKVSYDFRKLPDEFNLSREKNILEYSFYKYKPMLQKADEFIKHRHVRDAINYYRVVCDQNIPIEFKAMIKRNIRDLTEYLEKYLSSE